MEISWEFRPGVLTGIDKVYYKNGYQQTTIVYGLYPLRDLDPATLPPMRDGDYNCVTKRVVEHFECTLQGQINTHQTTENAGMRETGPRNRCHGRRCGRNREDS